MTNTNTTTTETTLADHVLWNVLQTCRKNRGLSTRQAAKILQRAQPVISRWESGRNAIGEETLVHVARCYGVTVRELLLEGLAPPKAPKTKKRTASKKTLAG